MSSAYQKSSISTKGAEIGTLSHRLLMLMLNPSQEFLCNEISTTLKGSIDY
jgi:hypothetical protein